MSESKDDFPSKPWGLLNAKWVIHPLIEKDLCPSEWQDLASPQIDANYQKWSQMYTRFGCFYPSCWWHKPGEEAWTSVFATPLTVASAQALVIVKLTTTSDLAWDPFTTIRNPWAEGSSVDDYTKVFIRSSLHMVAQCALHMSINNHIILYYIILYCIVLYYIILYYIYVCVCAFVQSIYI